MNNVEKLKKFKELLDNGIITQEEFDKKKCELLAGSMLYSDNEGIMGVSKQTKTSRKPLMKARMKKVIFAVVIVAVLIIGRVGINKIIVHNQRTTRAAALEEEIQPIMKKYGLTPNTVRYGHYGYEVYAEGFELLTNGEGLECLTELDNVSVDDPCSDGEIKFGDNVDHTARIHPGLDIEYSYFRVSSIEALMNEDFNETFDANLFTTPGLYCNRYGNECVYECKNY